MGIRIHCQKKIILDCSNTVFDALYQGVKMVVEKQNIHLKKNIAELLHEMDQYIWGFGAIHVDIADFIKNRADLFAFANLVENGLIEIDTECSLSDNAKKVLSQFHKDLLEFGEELS